MKKKLEEIKKLIDEYGFKEALKISIKSKIGIKIISGIVFFIIIISYVVVSKSQSNLNKSITKLENELISKESEYTQKINYLNGELKQSNNKLGQVEIFFSLDSKDQKIAQEYMQELKIKTNEEKKKLEEKTKKDTEEKAKKEKEEKDENNEEVKSRLKSMLSSLQLKYKSKPTMREWVVFQNDFFSKLDVLAYKTDDPMLKIVAGDLKQLTSEYRKALDGRGNKDDIEYFTSEVNKRLQ